MKEQLKSFFAILFLFLFITSLSAQSELSFVKKFEVDRNEIRAISNVGDVIYASAIGADATIGGLFKSTNGGENWISVNNGITDFTFQSVFALDANTAFAGTEGRKLFRTIDGGNTWTIIGDENTIANTPILSIYASDLNNIIVGVNGTGAMFKTSDGGGTWNPVTSPAPFGLIVSIASADGTTIYAANAFDAVYKSTDGGLNWGNFSTGIPSGGGFFQELAVIDSNTAFLANNADGILKTTDGGASWATINTGLSSLLTSDIHVVGPDTLFTVSDQVYRSTDGGATWVGSNSGLPNAPNDLVALDGKRVIVGSWNDGVYCSYSGAVLMTQTEVDDFATNFGSPTDFGNLTIADDNNGTNNITNLNGLMGLVTVENLIISGNDNLPNLTGLNLLDSVTNDLVIFDNDQLMDIIALGTNSLKAVGGNLRIEKNAVLEDLDGLNELTLVGNTIVVSDNTALTNINGIMNLAAVGGNLEVSDNENLTACQGIGQLVDESGMAVEGNIMVEENNAGCNDIDEVIASLPPIPTLSQWGIMILGICLLILGLVSTREKVFSIK